MSQQNVPDWQSWVVPVLAVFGFVGAIVKKLFTNAVRTQMAGMHQENSIRLDGVANRIGVVENTLARIEGRMQERWGDYQENER